jgi:hypothetical protein
VWARRDEQQDGSRRNRVGRDVKSEMMSKLWPVCVGWTRKLGGDLRLGLDPWWLLRSG